MVSNTLREFLDRNHVKYTVLLHSPAFTAQEIAAAAHVPGNELAKSVILNRDGKLVMAVLPASQHVDVELLKAALGATVLTIAQEREFRARFPDCELGAMPPFGNLYDMPVFVADTLAEDEEIAFNAGTFTELVRMRYADFARLVQPTILHFAATV